MPIRKNYLSQAPGMLNPIFDNTKPQYARTIFHDLRKNIVYTGGSSSNFYFGDLVLEGKFYFELLKPVNRVPDMGFVDITLPMFDDNSTFVFSSSKYPSEEVDGRFVGIAPNNYFSSVKDYLTGGVNFTSELSASSDDNIMIAVDTIAGHAWIGIDGVWKDGLTPESGVPLITFTPNLQMRFYMKDMNTRCYIPSKADNCAYPIPNGFKFNEPVNIGTLLLVNEGLTNYGYTGLSSHYGFIRSDGNACFMRTKESFVGKLYVELHVYDNQRNFGFCADKYDMTSRGYSQYLGDNAPLVGGDGWYNDDGVGFVISTAYQGKLSLDQNTNVRYTVPDFTYGAYDTLMFALDTETGSFWIGKNGVWHDDPLSEPPTVTVNAGLRWCLFSRGGDRTYANIIHSDSEMARYTPPTGFRLPGDDNTVSGNIIDSAGSATVGKVSCHYLNLYNSKQYSSVETNILGEFTTVTPKEDALLICETSEGVLTKTITADHTGNVVFDYSASGGEPVDPTFKAMIRGNVEKLGLPYGAEIIGVSNTTPPKVVGSTVSDSVTGDYELDVAPFQGQVNVMAIPDYGIEFVTNTVLPVGTTIRPTVPNGFLYRITEDGTTGDTEPTWPTVENQVVTSGSVTMVTEYMLRPLVNSLLTPVIEPI